MQVNRCRWLIISNDLGPHFAFAQQAVEPRYNIKIDVREMAQVGMDWNNSPQDRDQGRALVNMLMNLQV
jgi:hypothetical protein